MPDRLLIVDDHALFGHGVALLVRQQLGLEAEVVASIELAMQALRADETLVAALVDLQLPGLSGLEGIARLRALRPALAVVVCSSHDGDGTRQAALARGARAFIAKSETPDVLLGALRRALSASGGPTGAHGRETAGGAAPAAQALTARQREVLWLVAEGKSNKVIARQLAMSENTVRNHVAAILDRLGVDNRLEAATAARRLGLLDNVM